MSYTERLIEREIKHLTKEYLDKHTRNELDESLEKLNNTIMLLEKDLRIFKELRGYNIEDILNE